jgi:hypothetical protein
MPFETLDAINELLYEEKEAAYNMVAEAQRKIDPELLVDGGKGLTTQNYKKRGVDWGPKRAGRGPPAGMSYDNDDPWPTDRHSFVEDEDGDAAWERWEASLNNYQKRLRNQKRDRIDTIRKWYRWSLLPKFGKHNESR